MITAWSLGPRAARPMKAVMEVATPVIVRTPLGISSMYTPGYVTGTGIVGSLPIWRAGDRQLVTEGVADGAGDVAERRAGALRRSGDGRVGLGKGRPDRRLRSEVSPGQPSHALPLVASTEGIGQGPPGWACPPVRYP